MKKITVYQEEAYKELGDLYGLFFEDINHAADGGLYGELVQNRSFEFDAIDKEDYHSLTAWDKSGDVEWKISTKLPLHVENTHYLTVTAGQNGYIRNLGFNSGIYVEEGKKYDFSVWARWRQDESGCQGLSGTAPVLTVSVVDEDGIICAGVGDTLKVDGSEWRKYELVLTASKTTTKGRLQLEFTEAGTVDLDMVSLFPQDTFLGKKGGLRRDIAEALQEMKPKFMRFPGGCLTHDGNLDDKARNSMYRWRRTLGPVEQRPTWRNNWRYNQTLGLGFYEYFCFCEEIGAKPLPVVPAGFNPHKGEGVPISEIDGWVQETLDLIEFANGDETTVYGKIRAGMGHPEPFGLEYLGIGNEEIGDGFFERYPYFHKAVREHYPDIKIINTAGPFAVGEGYEAGWESAKKYGSDLVDEHYYSSPEWFLGNMHHYDDFDENGPKVFLGEYASWGNTYYNAIVEAAYMTHMERAKAVALACYAPMLANVDYVNWRPDMLWFDNHRIMKTPNYHVQKMFMVNQGTKEVRHELENLSEIIPLSDSNTLPGEIRIQGNDVAGRIWDIKVTEYGKNTECALKGTEAEKAEDLSKLQNRTEVITEYPELVITTENKEHVIKHVESEAYTLEFKFRRTVGRKGLKIFFGKTETEHTLWEFGGWDNWDCNITSFFNGRGSTISHRIFHVEDMEYQLRLEVEGRRIRTYVNGVLWNDTVNRLPELEELYVATSVEETKDGSRTIVKAVNLTGEAKQVTICLQGMERKVVEITELSGHSLTEENSLDAPNRVAPKEMKGSVEENQFSYTFPAHSVTVFSFR